MFEKKKGKHSDTLIIHPTSIHLYCRFPSTAAMVARNPASTMVQCPFIFLFATVLAIQFTTTTAFALAPTTRTTTTSTQRIITAITPSWRTKSIGKSSPETILHLSTETLASASSLESNSNDEYVVLKPDEASDEWEMDCYSRPVVVNGKKLWEVLITDSAGSFRFRKALPSNSVNSKTLRQTVEDVIDLAVVKPSTIRFFRGAMFNMINIALQELPDVTSKPSRCTFQLASWLEELYSTTYPDMPGYNPGMLVGAGAPSFLNVKTPVKLPDALRGEQYAFVALPVAEFLPGGDVNDENIGVGRLCPLPTTGPSQQQLPGDAFVQGIVILTTRAKALASWLAGSEVVALTADLRKRILTMEAGIDTQFLMAKLNDQQRAEAAAFEEGKDALSGLHFLSVQVSDDDEEPAGFWLLRDLPRGI